MNKIFILLAVFMGISCSTRETKYNEYLWKNPVNNYTRSNMADDVIKIITENKYSENDVIKMLGKPDFTGDYGYLYRLFGNKITMSVLRIEFINGFCSKAFVLQGD